MTVKEGIWGKKQERDDCLICYLGMKFFQMAFFRVDLSVFLGLFLFFIFFMIFQQVFFFSYTEVVSS